MADNAKPSGRSFIEQWYGRDSIGASVERDVKSGNVRVLIS